MKRIEQYHVIIQSTCPIRRKADEIKAIADNMEEEFLRRSGVVHKDRGPGFSGWYHESLLGYYDSPVQVLEALDKADENRYLPLEKCISEEK